MITAKIRKTTLMIILIFEPLESISNDRAHAQVDLIGTQDDVFDHCFPAEACVDARKAYRLPADEDVAATTALQMHSGPANDLWMTLPLVSYSRPLLVGHGEFLVLCQCLDILLCSILIIGREGRGKRVEKVFST